jgi:hypothetical protein
MLLSNTGFVTPRNTGVTGLARAAAAAGWDRGSDRRWKVDRPLAFPCCSSAAPWGPTVDGGARRSGQRTRTGGHGNPLHPQRSTQKEKTQMPKYSEKTTRWEQLLASIAANTDELGAALQTERTELEQLLAQAKQLDNRQDFLRAESSEVTRLRQEVDRQGEDLRGRLTAILKGKYGMRNNKLKEFGLAPFKPASRRKPEPEAPAPEPPSAPTPAAPKATPADPN